MKTHPAGGEKTRPAGGDEDTPGWGDEDTPGGGGEDSPTPAASARDLPVSLNTVGAAAGGSRDTPAAFVDFEQGAGLAGARGRSGRGVPKSWRPRLFRGALQNFGGTESQNRIIILRYRTRSTHKLTTILHAIAKAKM